MSAETTPVETVEIPAAETTAPKKANPLHTGSTRMRLFKALKKFPDGLTPNKIKEKTGMLPNSGHLSVLLIEELAKKRIRKEKHTYGEREEKSITVYTLTKKGIKDLADGKIDGNSHAGNRIGQLWTKPRKKAEKAKKAEAAAE